MKSSQFYLTNISWNYGKTSKNQFNDFFRQLNCAQVILVNFLFCEIQNECPQCPRISTLKKWVTLVAYLVMIIWLSRIMVIWVISPDLPAYYTNSKREKDISKDVGYCLLEMKKRSFSKEAGKCILYVLHTNGMNESNINVLGKYFC